MLLDVRGLACRFRSGAGEVRAVDGIDLDVRAGSTLGLAGESGAGKSAAALAILGLLPDPGEVVAGAVRFKGRDLLRLGPEQMRRVRGGEIGTVFQEPDTALNPVFPVGYQIAEVLRCQRGLSKARARERSVELLRRVGLADADLRARQWPHQLSGGMRQRALIAMAIACEPALLIADEATTALDVTLEAQILELVDGLRAATGMGCLWITHDLSVLARIADEVCVMYAGRIVERAPTAQLYHSPRHPYTILMLRSLRELRAPARAGQRAYAIPGSVPHGLGWPSGCAFRTRCPIASDRCAASEPPLEPAPDSPGGPRGAHLVRCHHLEQARVL